MGGEPRPPILSYTCQLIQVIVALATHTTVCQAETNSEIMNARMVAIEALADKAQQLCAPLPSDVTRTTTNSIDAEASVKLSQAFKMIADAGASTAIKHSSTVNENVPHEALLQLLEDRANCPVNFVEKMAPLILVPLPGSH